MHLRWDEMFSTGQYRPGSRDKIFQAGIHSLLHLSLQYSLFLLQRLEPLLGQLNEFVDRRLNFVREVCFVFPHGFIPDKEEDL